MGLFFVGTPFEITWATTTTWAIIIALVLVVKLTLRKVEKVPRSGAQHLFEMLFDFLIGWLSGFMGSRKTARKFLPLLTIFSCLSLSRTCRVCCRVPVRCRALCRRPVAGVSLAVSRSWPLSPCKFTVSARKVSGLPKRFCLTEPGDGAV